MVQLLADENFNWRILRGLRRRLPAVDLLLVQETELSQAEDPHILDWAAANHRVVLTHDVNTMTKYAYERLEAGESVPGVVIVPKELAIGSAIDDLDILLTCSAPDEFAGRVIHLPNLTGQSIFVQIGDEGKNSEAFAVLPEDFPSFAFGKGK